MAAGVQTSFVGPPNALAFRRDPNDFASAIGRPPNLSGTLSFRGLGRIELLVDVFNALSDSAEEALATDNLFGPTFGRGVAFADPRRAMIGVRLNVGK